MSDRSDRLHLDSDKVCKEELLHQAPGRERVRVTVEYVNGEARIHEVHKSLLATLLKELDAVEDRI
jgi:hypothetical protein